MSKTLIFTATYNEKDNINKLIENLNKLKVDLDILVIDDNSPDKLGKFYKN
jgi:dolichol-phosphate mannosyltransferase